MKLKKVKKFQIFFTIFLSFSLMGVLMLLIHRAIHSRLFVLENFEFSHSILPAPFDEDVLIKLVSTPLKSVNLFELDLQILRKRLLKNEWVRDVKLQRKFLHTLSIYVDYQEPLAIFQHAQNKFSYVNEEGKVFGIFSLMDISDLPIITGLVENDEKKIKRALEIIKVWQESNVGEFVNLASIHWDSKRGYRALMIYSLEKGRDKENLVARKIRTMVDLGDLSENYLKNLSENIMKNKFDTIEYKFSKLYHVFKYLKDNNIASRQVWTDTGKKVVVKIARGS